MEALCHLHDAQQRVGLTGRGHVLRKLGGQSGTLPAAGSLGGRPSRLTGEERVQIGTQRRHPWAVGSNGSSDVQRSALVVQEPARRPLHHAAQGDPQFGGIGGAETGLATQPYLVEANGEDGARGQLSPDDVGDTCAGLRGEPVVARDPLAVYEAVHGDGGDDLARQPVAGHRFGVALSQGLREVLHQPVGQVRIVGQVGGQHPPAQRDLRVRQQDGEFRPGESVPCGDPCAHLVAGGQELQPAVEQALGLQRAHPGLVLAGERDPAVHRVGEREVLVEVVGQHQLGNLAGHGRQQLVASSPAQPPGRDVGGKQDLDVHLMVGGVDAGGVVDEVGVHPAAGLGVLDTPELGEAEVPALRDAAGPELAPVHADAVIGLVAGLCVALAASLYEGPDPTVEQQVDLCCEDGAD